jgi:hypothetical protein
MADSTGKEVFTASGSDAMAGTVSGSTGNLVSGPGSAGIAGTSAAAGTLRFAASGAAGTGASGAGTGKLLFVVSTAAGALGATSDGSGSTSGAPAFTGQLALAATVAISGLVRFKGLAVLALPVTSDGSNVVPELGARGPTSANPEHSSSANDWRNSSLETGRNTVVVGTHG